MKKSTVAIVVAILMFGGIIGAQTANAYEKVNQRSMSGSYSAGVTVRCYDNGGRSGHVANICLTSEKAIKNGYGPGWKIECSMKSQGFSEWYEAAEVVCKRHGQK